MNENFEVRNEYPYNLRQSSQFSQPLVKSLYHGSECLSYLGPKVWDILPNIYKNIDGLEKLKRTIENGNLRIVLLELVKSTLKMSVLYRKQCLNYLLVKNYLLSFKLIFSGVMILN